MQPVFNREQHLDTHLGVRRQRKALRDLRGVRYPHKLAHTRDNVTQLHLERLVEIVEHVHVRVIAPRLRTHARKAARLPRDLTFPAGANETCAIVSKKFMKVAL